MLRIAALFRRLTARLRRGRLERDLDAELAFHLAMRQAERIQLGVPAPQAQLASRAQFGSVLRVKEQSRDAWVIACLESVLQDLRIACRGLRRAPGFCAAAVLTLGLGIGGSTAIFSVVNSTLLRPLPYEDADRLVRIVENVPPAESPSGLAHRTTMMNEAAFLWWREHATTLASIEAILATSMTAQVGGETLRLTGARVSGSLFRTLGAAPAVGRLLTPVDADSNVAVLSAAAWGRLFSSDPNVVGRTISLDGVLHTVVGIAASDFAIPSPQTDLWTPYVVRPVPNRIVAVDVLAKLRGGVSIEAASAEARALGNSFVGEPPADGPLGPPSPPRFEVVGLQNHIVEPVRPALQVLMGAVILVLLNVCANVANLLMARSAAREREFGLRRALGAGRSRVTRQLLTEGIVLSMLGGLIGIGLAIGGIALVKALTPINLPALYGGSRTMFPGMERIGIDASVLTFTVMASAATGVVFALVPALHFSRLQVVGLRGQPIGSGMTRTGTGIRRALAMSQLGLATMLLIAAGLLVRSFVKLSNVDLGYNPVSALTFELVLPEQLPQPRKLELANDLAARLSSLPPVISAGFTSAAPLSTLNGGWALTPPAAAAAQLLERPELRVGASSISPDYLRAIGVRLLEGRWLDRDHGINDPPALLVNRTLAHRFFGDDRPLGRSVSIGGRSWLVAGVVDDVRSKGLDSEPEPRGYLDHDRLVADAHDAGWDRFAAVPAPTFLSFAVRVDRDPLNLVREVRRIVSDLEPLAVVDGAVAMEDVVSGALVRPRFYAVLVGLFAGLAVVIAAVGIYGVLSYAVARRTREIGIRIALGATNRGVMAMVARDAGVTIGAGTAIGVGGAVALTRYLQTLLFGLTPLDGTTFLAVPLLCGLVAVVASYVPARRATRVDPMEALRCE